MRETKLERKRRSGRERQQAFRDRQKAQEAASFSNYWEDHKLEFKRTCPKYYKSLEQWNNEIESLENLVEEVLNDSDVSRVTETYAAVIQSVEKRGSLNYEAIEKEVQERRLVLPFGPINDDAIWDAEKGYYVWYGFRLAISEDAVRAIRERYDQIKQPQAEPQVEPQPISVQAQPEVLEEEK